MFTLTIYRVSLPGGGWAETADHIEGAVARTDGRLLKRYQIQCRIDARETGSKAYRITPREK